VGDPDRVRVVDLVLVLEWVGRLGVLVLVLERERFGLLVLEREGRRLLVLD
jgi:hypothetical protein